ncbi:MULTISPECIES: response regulator [Paenibacillus]|uniref:response regulator n=1 Tax=Paenibacillus TaxID=44249 RepID=UPI0022B92C91|nr:response regulator [Paenibacillus caseinilyticus]MCZ8518304.1 response regulator [Paenibacillus caseinilyticus]
MKALIVDDEKPVREAVRYLIPWDSYGIQTVLEAGNGLEAQDLIRSEQPAIIVTDMSMPLMDGAGLLEWIHEHAPGAKTIVISGHSEFQYVKHAILYRGVDYLLKPLNRSQLISAMDRATTLWRQEQEERCRQLDQNVQLNILRPLYWDKVFSDIMSGARNDADAASSLMEEFGIRRNCRECRIAVISMRQLDSRLKDRLNGDLSLLSFIMTNVCNEILKGGRDGYAFRYLNTGLDMVLVLWGRVNRAGELAHEINRAFEQTYGVQFHMGLGSVQPFPGGLRPSFEEARLALRQRNLLQMNQRVHEWREGMTEERAVLSLKPVKEKLTFAILSRDAEKLEAVLREWEGKLNAEQIITESVLEGWMEELSGLLDDWRTELLDSDAASQERAVITPPFDSSGNFSLGLWKERVRAALRTLMDRWSFIQKRDDRLVHEIKQYLDLNYKDEITLQDMAERFFLSKGNVSRKFKQVTSENLTEYLSRIRIEKAKNLLVNPSIRISQIAEWVGFQDDKYFSRVFKKLTGTTPREFRNKGAGAGEHRKD